MEVILRWPLEGVGLEGINAFQGFYEYVGLGRPHNEYLQYTAFYGIPGGLAYLCGCFGVYLRTLRRKTELDTEGYVCLTAAFGYLVSAFFGITLYCTTPFLFLFLGMGYAGIPYSGKAAEKREGTAQEEPSPALPDSRPEEKPQEYGENMAQTP